METIENKIIVAQEKLKNAEKEQETKHEEITNLRLELSRIIGPRIKELRLLDKVTWTIDQNYDYFSLSSKTEIIRESEILTWYKMINYEPIYLTPGVIMKYNQERGELCIHFEDSFDRKGGYKIGFDFLTQWQLKLDWSLVTKNIERLNNDIKRTQILQERILNCYK